MWKIIFFPIVVEMFHSTDDDLSSDEETTRNDPLLDAFISLLNSILEEDHYQQTISYSMETFQEELFRKRTDLRADNLVEGIFSETEAAEPIVDKKCYICLEDLRPGQMFSRLPCNHRFHKACMDELVSHQHKTCPLCRVALPIVEKTENGPDSRHETQDGHRIAFY